MLGLIFPAASTVTGTVTVWPFASTVTAPAIGTDTFDSVTRPSPSVSVSVYDFPSPSTRVTVAPPSTVTVTSFRGFFSSTQLGGFAKPPKSTLSKAMVVPKYPAAVTFTFG